MVYWYGLARAYCRGAGPITCESAQRLFEPGSRTAWHTHPLGQTLYVVKGLGFIGLRNEPPRVIGAGDTVWIPPKEEHWHGAGPNNPMEHIAIQEAFEGIVADWLEKVTEADYSRLD